MRKSGSIITALVGALLLVSCGQKEQTPPPSTATQPPSQPAPPIIEDRPSIIVDEGSFRAKLNHGTLVWAGKPKGDKKKWRIDQADGDDVGSFTIEVTGASKPCGPLDGDRAEIVFEYGKTQRPFFVFVEPESNKPAREPIVHSPGPDLTHNGAQTLRYDMKGGQMIRVTVAGGASGGPCTFGDNESPKLLFRFKR